VLIKHPPVTASGTLIALFCHVLPKRKRRVYTVSQKNKTLYVAFVANLPMCLSVKDLWTSLNIWGSYAQVFSVLIFWLTVYIECNCYGCISISVVTKNYILGPTPGYNLHKPTSRCFLPFFSTTSIREWMTGFSLDYRARTSRPTEWSRETVNRATFSVFKLCNIISV